MSEHRTAKRRARLERLYAQPTEPKLGPRQIELGQWCGVASRWGLKKWPGFGQGRSGKVVKTA